ncbi:hypothetical protein MKW98_020453 [Papaver atlanticum]|uniref:PB1 domain-containing protein n=1 Tax=Papaver atlanticum TaxID=357466 RepID=A0AAD4RVP8_9MAGN|nr:hypothetical protein MKW98_020453 [Papaver atlanticum]
MKLGGYDELIDELDQMFDYNGALIERSNGWNVIYVDDEGDTMQIGDYPWQEFQLTHESCSYAQRKTWMDLIFVH